VQAGRKKFEHQGHPVYEWEQNLSEMLLVHGSTVALEQLVQESLLKPVLHAVRTTSSAQPRQKPSSKRNCARSCSASAACASSLLLSFRPPPGVKANDLAIEISNSRLRVGLKGAAKPFVDEDFFDTVVAKDSMWAFGDGVVEVNARKMRKAATWGSVLKGHGALDPLVKEAIQKKMTLERFQEEHPKLRLRRR
jgi:hypothetical protein